jgi:long-chain acyl-CoA synthetase
MPDDMTASSVLVRDDEPLQASTICAAFQRAVRRYGEQEALRAFGETDVLTWSDYGEKVEAVARGLAALGIIKGDTVALQLANRPQFHVVDMAALHLGATPFSIYNSSSPDQIAERLETASARVLVTERAFLGSVEQALSLYEGIEHVVVVDGPIATALSLDAVVASGDDGLDFEATWRAVEPDDLTTLIFTSGTTGPPKAAELSHQGVMGTLQALSQVIPMPRHAMVSFLPMAHIGERMWTQYMTIVNGAATTCCSGRDQLFDCLRETRPDLPFMVPRLWEKLRPSMGCSSAWRACEPSRPASEHRLPTWPLTIARSR